jgi:hypothetical protein
MIAALNWHCWVTRRVASSRGTDSAVEKTRHWREWRCGFLARSNRCAGYMTCGPGPPCWYAGCDGAEKGPQPWCDCMLPAWRSTFSTASFGEDGGTLITAGRLHASCAVIWLLPFRVSPHDVWDPAPTSEGENPGTRQWRLCPRRLGVGVKRSAFKKGSIPRAVAMPSHSSHPSRPSTFRALRWGAPVLPSFCCCLRSATPWGLALFSHCSASRIFIMQPGCSPSPMVICGDDHQPCGGEKQAGLRPLPRPQVQGCSSSGLGRRAHQGGACLHVGRRPASSSSIRGRRASVGTMLRRRRSCRKKQLRLKLSA